MRFTKLLTGVAAAALAVSAAAQEMPADAPAKAEEPQSGLSGLSETVDQLSDDQPAEAQEQPRLETENVVADDPSAQPETAESGEPAAGDTATTGDDQAGEPQTEEPVQPTVPSGPPPELTAEQRADIDRAARRGRQLVALAHAGALASQDMLSRVADPEAVGISGWVAEPEGNAMAVTFYADGEDGPVAVYRTRVLAGRTVSRETFLTGDRPPLTGVALRMARARAASESEEQNSCTNQPFNVLIIPPASADAPIDVYRITPPELRGRIPLGGHFRTRVAADNTITESHAFTRGCLNLDAGEVPAGVQPGPIGVTHLTGDLPTEVHVFLSLFSGRPLVVAAGNPVRLFAIAGDSIREIPR